MNDGSLPPIDEETLAGLEIDPDNTDWAQGGKGIFNQLKIELYHCWADHKILLALAGLTIYRIFRRNCH